MLIVSSPFYSNKKKKEWKKYLNLNIFMMVLTIINSFSYGLNILSFSNIIAYILFNRQRDSQMFKTFNFDNFRCKTFLYPCKWNLCRLNWVYEEQQKKRDKRKCQKPFWFSFPSAPSLFCVCLCVLARVCVSESHTLLCEPFTLSFIGIIVCIFGIHSFSLCEYVPRKRQKTNDFDRR